MPKKEKWIDILKEEPPAGQGVLIALSTGLITIGYRKLKKNSHDWQIFGSMEFLGLCQDDFVTHWMPLPEPPDHKLNDASKELYQYPSHYRKRLK